MWSYELYASGSGYGPVMGCCEHRNKPSSYIKGGEFFDYLSDLDSQEGLFSMELVS
jgi:hypothetical protein